jgi:hypothetical protein
MSDTTATTATKTALEQSIEDLAQADYNVPSGYVTRIYLDPEAGTVYAFASDSSSQPKAAYDGVDRLIVSVNDRAVPQSVADAMPLDTLRDMLGCYGGTEFDGRNYRGTWSDAEYWNQGGYIELDELQQAIAYYWDPGEWFDPVISDLKAAWANGDTSAEIIDTQNLDSGDAVCDRDAAIEWLESMFIQWADENND